MSYELQHSFSITSHLRESRDARRSDKEVVEGSPSAVVGCRLYLGEEAHEVVKFYVLERLHSLALNEVWTIADEEGLEGEADVWNDRSTETH